MRNSAIVLCLLLAGCATSGKINRVQLGMTKQQVIQTMGQPVSVSAQAGSEYLNYKLSETSDDAFVGVTTPYYVRLINGKVDSFGRTGDFNSTKDQSITIKTDNTNRGDAPAQDRYDRLLKLNELRKSGAISEDEYNAEKAKLLN